MAHRGSPVTSATTSRIFVRSAGESSIIASPRFRARRHASTSRFSLAVTGKPPVHSSHGMGRKPGAVLSPLKCWTARGGVRVGRSASHPQVRAGCRSQPEQP
jgi:hypothetical protein